MAFFFYNMQYFAEFRKEVVKYGIGRVLTAAELSQVSACVSVMASQFWSLGLQSKRKFILLDLKHILECTSDRFKADRG